VLMAGGCVADVDLRPLSSGERGAVQQKMEEGRAMVREDVRAAEFINVTARSPG